jgi:hypothetical protein
MQNAPEPHARHRLFNALCTARMHRRTALGTVVAALVTSSFVVAARADQAGCTVVLCLANPAGWASIPDCVAPVRAFFRRLAKGGGAPSCGEARVTFSFGAKVIGSTTNSEGVETPITRPTLLMRNADGSTTEIEY